MALQHGYWLDPGLMVSCFEKIDTGRQQYRDNVKKPESSLVSLGKGLNGIPIPLSGSTDSNRW